MKTPPQAPSPIRIGISGRKAISKRRTWLYLQQEQNDCVINVNRENIFFKTLQYGPQ